MNVIVNKISFKMLIIVKMYVDNYVHILIYKNILL